MTSTGKKRSGAELWKSLKEQEIEDDISEFSAMSESEIDQYISANGGDPDAIGASGEQLVKELLARKERLSWHGDMEAKLAAFRKTAEASKSTTKLPRAEILARLAVARNNPRFAAPAAMLFQKKTSEASTDEELQAMLDELELLAKLEE